MFSAPFTGKKFGVTDFVSAVNNGGKPVSQVSSQNLLIKEWLCSWLPHLLIL